MGAAELLAEIVEHMGRHDIAFDDIQSLLVNRLGLAAYFPACRRWADLGLARCWWKATARPVLGLKPRCRDRGERGVVQLRAPAPSGPGAVLYVSPSPDIAPESGATR